MPNTNPSSMYGAPNFIVDATPGKGSHTTISAAMTAASSPANIFIRPGTYTENITGKAGVNLIAYTGDNANTNLSTALVTINGTYSCSFTGNSAISGINFTTNSAPNILITGSNVATINIESCSFMASNAYSITHSGTNTKLILRDCYSDFTSASASVGFMNLSGLRAEIYGHLAVNSSVNTTAGILHSGGGSLAVNSSNFQMIYAGSGASTVFFFNYCIFDTSLLNVSTIVQQATGNVSGINYCSILSGSGASVTLGTSSLMSVTKSVITSTATNAITQLGASTITYDDISFTANSNINVTTQTRLKQSTQNLTGLTFDGANILQNYSTGTFTPTAVGLTVAGTPTYSAQGGRYTRVGNRVCIQVAIGWTAHTGTGNLSINNLPFTSANNVGFNIYTSGYFYNSTANTSFDLLYQVQPNTTSVLAVIPGTGLNSYLTVTATQLHQFTLWYEV